MTMMMMMMMMMELIRLEGERSWILCVKT